MRSPHIATLAAAAWVVSLGACSSHRDESEGVSTHAPDGPGGAAVPAEDAGSSERAPAATDGGAEAGPPPIVVGPGNDVCEDATPIPISAAHPRMVLDASTLGAKHDVDVACSTDKSGDVFYKFAVSKRVFVYADTFGATFSTALFLLSDTCAPIPTGLRPGEVTCSGDACGTQQSQIVALLEPGSYRLGLAGRGGGAGEAKIHFEWALAGSGAIAPLPKGNSVQSGTTTGSGGNIDGLSPECVAAGAEDSFFWTRCPTDLGGALQASTCGGTTWESIAAVQIPGAVPYACNLDGCGLQSNLKVNVPKGAGLGVLSIDGQGGNDFGAYALTVTRP